MLLWLLRSPSLLPQCGSWAKDAVHQPVPLEASTGFQNSRGDKRAPFEHALCSSWHLCIAGPFLGLVIAHFASLSVQAIQRRAGAEKAWKGGVRWLRPQIWQRTKCTFEKCTFVPREKQLSFCGGVVVLWVVWYACSFPAARFMALFWPLCAWEKSWHWSRIGGRSLGGALSLKSKKFGFVGHFGRAWCSVLLLCAWVIAFGMLSLALQTKTDSLDPHFAVMKAHRHHIQRRSDKWLGP